MTEREREIAHAILRALDENFKSTDQMNERVNESMGFYLIDDKEWIEDKVLRTVLRSMDRELQLGIWSKTQP